MENSAFSHIVGTAGQHMYSRIMRELPVATHHHQSDLRDRCLEELHSGEGTLKGSNRHDGDLTRIVQCGEVGVLAVNPPSLLTLSNQSAGISNSFLFSQVTSPKTCSKPLELALAGGERLKERWLSAHGVRGC
ncbi:predicted protein [Sclerotinia sclerotiorum 1980 UF-70]|uniref:Uncharacterized protein n=1 Tax=Sclerotinia sclerotiorum (strain ATCC 18683 / 1980 / Ss-1) TaxID=665079 RepID=A7EIK3_SCLS1|nr:predicted protein [Sclerotinia sclerotiorum 1980 UF-70]EDO02669.1 predicted protein [Sclerotinia sclerotiorum 1980 UF-70]